MIKSRTPLIVLCFALFLVASSCSKKTPVGDLSGGLLEKVPSGTFAYITWDTGTKAYERYNSSAWGKAGSSSITTALQSVSETRAKAVIEALTKTGLLPTEVQRSSVIKSGVVFARGSSQALPEGGMYLAAKKGISFSDKLASIRTVLDQQGFKPSNASFNKVDGFTVAFSPEGNPAAPKMTAFFGATPEKMAIATSADLVSQLFSDKPGGGLDEIKQSAEYKKAVGQIGPLDDQLFFTYLDFKRMSAYLSDLIPQEAKKEVDVAKFPLDSLAGVRTMGKSPLDVYAIGISPKNADQKRWVSALFSAAGKDEIVGKVPGNLLGLISVDGRMLASIKNTAMSEVPVEKQRVLQNQLALVDNIEGLGLGIRTAQGASPFPEVMVLIRSGKAEETKAGLQEHVKTAMMSGGPGLGGMPWSEKDVMGVKVSYVLTPFGVGLYLGHSGELVFLASSEGAIQDLLKAEKDSDQALVAQLSRETRKIAENSNSLAMTYVDYGQVYNLMSSMMGTLSMFTGGQANMDLDLSDYEYLKGLGSNLSVVKYADGHLHIQSSYELPKKG